MRWIIGFGFLSIALAQEPRPAPFVIGVNGNTGTVSSIATGCGTSGGTITSSGTIKATEPVNTQTGTTYTYLDGDCGKLVSHSNAAAIAGTLPQANGSTFVSGWFTDAQNSGAGTLTITPTTSTIDGASSLALTTGQGVRIVSNGTNYFTQRGVGGGVPTSLPIGVSITGGTDGRALFESAGVLAQNANFLFNTSTLSPAVFTGSGLDDLTAGGSYADGAANPGATFTVVICTAATPDTFKWKKNSGAFSSCVAITGVAQALSNGATVTFAATTGHTVNDQWVTTAQQGLQVLSTVAFGSEGIVGNSTFVGRQTFFDVENVIVAANDNMFGEIHYTHTADSDAHNYNGWFGEYHEVDHLGSGTLGFLTAVGFEVTAGGIVGTIHALEAYAQGNGNAGTITEADAIYIQNGGGSANFTNARGIFIDTPTSHLGTVTNNIGIKIADQTGVGPTTNAWAIQTSLGLVEFGDLLQLDTLTASLPIIANASKQLISGTLHGNTTRFQMSDNTGTSGNLAKFDASGNTVDGGLSAASALASVHLSGTTGSIGGGLLAAGACTSGTVAVTSSTTSMVALADPNTYPGDGIIWDAQVTTNGTVTVKVCAILALTPAASTYNVRVIQ